MIMQGLFPKFEVARSDGKPIDPNAAYIVLRLDDDAEAAQAVMVYADLICDKEPFFAEDLYRQLSEQARRYECVRLDDFSTSPLEQAWVLWGHPDTVVTCPVCGRHGLSSPLRIDYHLPWRVVHRVAVLKGAMLPADVCFLHAGKD